MEAQGGKGKAHKRYLALSISAKIFDVSAHLRQAIEHGITIRLSTGVIGR
jgi:hypothetical protein